MPSSIYSNTEVENIDNEYKENKREWFRDSFDGDEELLVVVLDKTIRIHLKMLYQAKIC